MKKFKFLLMLPILASVMLTALSCGHNSGKGPIIPKDTIPKDTVIIPQHLYVILYDKDTATIQHYIQGKWNYVYAKGGFNGGYYIQYFDDGITIEFTSDKRSIDSNSNTESTITYSYYWKKVMVGCGGPYYYTDYPDSVYNLAPNYYSIVFDEIRNDTLMYSDNACDGMTYYLTKIY